MSDFLDLVIGSLMLLIYGGSLIWLKLYGKTAGEQWVERIREIASYDDTDTTP